MMQPNDGMGYVDYDLIKHFLQVYPYYLTVSSNLWSLQSPNGMIFLIELDRPTVEEEESARAAGLEPAGHSFKMVENRIVREPKTAIHPPWGENSGKESPMRVLCKLM